MQPATGSRARLYFRWLRCERPGADGQSAVGSLASNGVFGLLLNMLVAEKSGFQLIDQPAGSDLHEFTEKIAKQALEAIQQAVTTHRDVGVHQGNGAGPPATAAILPTSSRTLTEAKPTRKDGA